jgi:hypothetical protein
MASHASCADLTGRLGDHFTEADFLAELTPVWRKEHAEKGPDNGRSPEFRNPTAWHFLAILLWS